MICGFCQQGKTHLCRGEFLYTTQQGHWWIEQCLPESVLEEAGRLIAGDRNDTYGPFAEDFGRTVAIFNAWTGHSLSVADGVKFAIAIKMSRQVASPAKRDHYVDACGYWSGLAQVEEIG